MLTHEFSPNLTLLTFSALQLVSRNVQLGVAYGGVNVYSEAAEPSPQIIDVKTSARPRLLSLDVYVLVGHSDVPPALVELEKAESRKTQTAQPVQQLVS